MEKSELRFRPPIRYFPLEKSLYEVSPGLRPLGFDFEQGPEDSKIFQLDENFFEYRKNKIACYTEKPEKYFLTHEISNLQKHKLALFICDRLESEHPELFTVRRTPSGTHVQCHHTKDKIVFSSDGTLLDFHSAGSDFEENNVQVRTVLEALAFQMQEDFAVCSQSAVSDHLSLLHVCAPSHWSPAGKIGKSFFEVHAPVPGIDKINRAAGQMVHAMIYKGPFVRFVWSFVTDQRLNHHPEAPPGADAKQWKGRSFSLAQTPPFHLRIERQVTFGFPELNMGLFTIRVSFWSGLEIKNDQIKKSQILGALNSMTPESRVYKGVDDCFDELIRWLSL